MSPSPGDVFASDELRTLVEIGRVIGSQPDIDSVFDRVAGLIRQIVPFDRLAVVVMDPVAGTLENRYVAGMAIAGRSKGDRYPAAGTIAEGLSSAARAGLIVDSLNFDEIARTYPEIKNGLTAGLRSSISVPLVAHDSAIGVLRVLSTRDRAYGPRALAFAEGAAAQIAGAVAAAQMRADLERQSAEREVLAEIGRITVSSLDVGEIFERIAAEVSKLIPFDRIAVHVVDAGRRQMFMSYVSGDAIPGWSTGRSEALLGTVTGIVLESGKPVIVNDANTDEMLGRAPRLQESIKLLPSLLSVPVLSRNRPFGVVQFRSRSHNAYAPHHAVLAEQVAAYLGPAVENSRLFSESQRDAREREVLAEIGRIVAGESDIESVYPRFAEKVAELIPWDRLMVNRTDWARGVFIERFQAGLNVPGRNVGAEVPLAGSLTEDVGRTRKSVLLNLRSGPGPLESRWPEAMPGYNVGLRSYITVPLVHHDQVIGTIHFRSVQPGLYGEGHIRLAVAVAAQIAGAIAAADLNETVRREAEVRRSLAAISLAMSRDSRLDRALEDVADEIGRLIRFDRMAVSLRDGDSSAAKTVFVRGAEVEGFRAGAPFPAWLKSDWEWEATVSGQAPDFGPLRSSGLESALIVPFGSQGQTPVGFLGLRSHEKDAYTKEDLDLLGRVAAQMTPVLQNMIEHQMTVRIADERQVIAELGRLVSGTLTLEQMFPSFAEQLKRLVSYDRLVVTLLDEKTNEWVDVCVAGVTGPGGEQGVRWPYATRFRDGEDARQLVIRTGAESIELGKTRRNMRIKVEAGLRGQMIVPMFWQDRVIGSINLWSCEEAPYREREAALGRQIAAQVAGAIIASRAYTELQHEAEVRRSLAALGVAAGQDLNLDGIFDRVSGEVSKLVSYDRLSVALNENGGIRDVYVTGVEVKNHRVGAWYPERVDRQPAPHDAAFGGAAEDSHFREDMEAAGLQSWGIPPMAPGAQRPFGWRSLRSKSRDAYTPTDVDILNRIGVQIAPAVQNALAHSQEMNLAEERERAARLEAQAREMERVAEAKSMFLTTISHELRTPLTSISAFADILVRDRDANLNDRQIKQVNVIRRNSRLLAMLISDLLDLSRIDSGSFKIVTAGFDVAQMLSDVCENLRPMYEDKNQVLTRILPEPGTEAVADRDRLGQVVANLLSNASKYSPRGAEVVLKAEVKDGRLSVAVTDSGVGIGEGDMPRLFTMFFRVDNEATRSVPGSGIGLYIARQIVEMHGGKIEAVSQPGRGATFTFWIPREGPAPGAAQQ